MIATRSASATATCRFCSTTIADSPPSRRPAIVSVIQVDDARREPLGGLVEEEDARVGEQRAADRDHLLLAARELVAAVPAPLLQAREQLVDGVERPLDRSARRSRGARA